jgi:valyl-tRNA synthetase
MRLEGQEIRFQESRCEEARNFNNKIWNATRYMLALPEGLPRALTLPNQGALTVADRWILVRLHDTIESMSALLDAYDFGNAADVVWKFVWYEFCDWYVEATKAPENRATRAAVLSFVWNNAMRLLHPVAPFITEEVWLALPHDGATIMTATWPDKLEIPLHREDAALFEALQRTVERIRNLRSDMGLAPRAALAIEVPANVPEGVASLLALFTSGVVERGDATGGSIDDALAAVDGRAPKELLLERHRKDAVRLASEVERGAKKLANQQFIAKAAPDVVAKEREKLESYRSELARVREALSAMGESV